MVIVSFLLFILIEDGVAEAIMVEECKQNLANLEDNSVNNSQLRKHWELGELKYLWVHNVIVWCTSFNIFCVLNFFSKD